MLAVHKQGLVNVSHKKMACNPQPHLVVAAHEKAFVKPPDFFEARLAKHNRTGPEHRFPKQLGKNVAAGKCLLELNSQALVQYAAFIKTAGIGVNQGTVRMPVEIRHLQFQLAGKPQIIGIETSYKLFPAVSYAEVSGRRLTPVFLVQIPDSSFVGL